MSEREKMLRGERYDAAIGPWSPRASMPGGTRCFGGPASVRVIVG